MVGVEEEDEQAPAGLDALEGLDRLRRAILTDFEIVRGQVVDRRTVDRRKRIDAHEVDTRPKGRLVGGGPTSAQQDERQRYQECGRATGGGTNPPGGGRRLGTAG